MGCGVGVESGRGAAVAVLVAVAEGTLVTVMTTVTAAAGFAGAGLVGRAFTVGVWGVGATAVAQLVSRMRQKNKPMINRAGKFKTICRS